MQKKLKTIGAYTESGAVLMFKTSQKIINFVTLSL
jgi:hypothetical protein